MILRKIRISKKYIKLIIPWDTFVCFIIAVVISVTIVIIKEKQFETSYKESENLEFTAVVKSYSEKKEYTKEFIVEVENKKLIISTNMKEDVKYGDIIIVKGEYQNIRSYKNNGVFNYAESLKKQNIYGKVNAKKIEIIGESKNCYNYFAKSNFIIREKIKYHFSKQSSSILNSLVIGYKTDIESDIKEIIQENGLSHILAISGMHINCIMMIFQKMLDIFTEKSKKKKILMIIILILYGMIIGFIASAVRAIIMAILGITSKLVNKKNNKLIDIAIACLVILIYNPYYLIDSGFLLSFGATLGIIYIFPLMNKNKIKNKILKYIIETFLVSIAVNITIFPITIYFFKRISFSFFITGLIMAPLVFAIEILGIFIIFLPSSIVSILKNIVEFIIYLFIEIAKIDLGGLYFKVPNILEILIYYVVLILFLKKEMRKKIKKLIRLILKILIIIALILNIGKKLEKNLIIYFIDVGQGDCTLIQTEENIKLLIDGGGDEEYDVGKNVVIPYLLSKKVDTIDYMMVSHFDTDHVRRLYKCCQKIKSKKHNYI